MVCLKANSAVSPLTLNELRMAEAQRKVLEVLYLKSEIPKINKEFEREFKYLIPSDMRNYIPILDVIIRQRVDIKYSF